LEGSLKRLGTDYVDLFWLHAWDFSTPVEETMRALDDLVRSGKVLYVGVSDTPAWVVSQANMLAELRGWSHFIALQIEYSLIERTPERDLLPMARNLGMTVTPWTAFIFAMEASSGDSGRPTM
jgi:aryl-alcohol dehydrogenase-like predicted oxidoreductase